jgi:O-antigen ligase
MRAGATRLPILWLFFGPPVFRLAERGAEASLEGSVDVWNVVRILWWLALGLLALIDLHRLRAHLRPFLRGLGWLPVWSAAWLLALLASTAYSPSPVFTLSNAAMMVVLVVAALDLGLKLDTRAIAFDTVLRRLFGISVLLLAIATLAFFVAPELVGGGDAETGVPRVRGGRVADVALLAQITFFVGYHLANRARRANLVFYAIPLLLSPLFILLAQTRAMYVSFFAAVLVFLVRAVPAFGRQHRHGLLATACFGAAGLFGLAVVEGTAASAQGPLTQATQFLVRDPASLQGLNSRGGLTAFLLRRVGEQPWGLGYSAGPRLALLSSPEELRTYGIYEAFAGNAHSMYLEVLAGSGVVGLIAFVALLAWTAWRILRTPGRPNLPVATLFVIVLLGGVTESYGALPFAQASALLWILIALATSLERRGGVTATSAPSNTLRAAG